MIPLKQWAVKSKNYILKHSTARVMFNYLDNIFEINVRMLKLLLAESTIQRALNER